MKALLVDHPVLDEEIFDGFSLLEADAGTGKTWTLANLVVRALIERQVGIENIVVVTFTRKAAAELRERVLEAISLLEAALDGEAIDDVFVRAYLPRCEPQRDRHRLRRARALFDEAPISTIHGLCQRILAEQPLTIGQPDAPELADRDAEYREAAAMRWWRRLLLEEDPDTIEVLIAAGNDAACLAAGLGHLDLPGGDELQPAPVDRHEFARALHELVPRVRQALLHEEHELVAKLPALPGINRRSYQTRSVRNWCAELRDWLASPAAVLRKRLERADQRLSASGIREAGGADGAGFMLPVLLDELHALLARRSGLRAGLLVAMQPFVAAELARRKREERVQSYDDLLVRTRDALREPGHGEVLAARLRHRYPVVLVDECQDTDPWQWEILRRLHAPSFAGERDKRLALVLVGDPKQAIYSFRNADIFAYLLARRDAHRRLRLGQNQRSSDALVAGLNALFSMPGAFLLEEIEWQPAQATSRPRPQWRSPAGDTRRALNFVEVSADGTATPQAAVAYEAMASEIARLLAGESGAIVQTDGSAAAPRARDIAVLVRRAADGVRAKEALHAYGVDAVEISRASVYSTLDARELLRVVAAVAAPADASAVRSALVTSLLGLDAVRLEQAAASTMEWNRLIECFVRAARTWRQHGPVAALRRLLFLDFAAMAELAAARDAERRLTNLLHLLELLGAMPALREEPARARVELARQIARTDGTASDEAAELRLESDADLVQILTMHKAKGLEFPIVFVPASWQALRPVRKDDWIQAHAADGNGGWRRILVCGPTDQNEGEQLARLRERAQLEANAEAIRLLYVAATRAEQRLYLFWRRPGNRNSGRVNDNPVRMLLGEAAGSRIAAMASELPDSVSALGLADLAGAAGIESCAGQQRSLRAREFRAALDAPWEERSYTSLMRALQRAPADDLAIATANEPPRPDHDELALAPPRSDTDDPAGEVRERGASDARHGFPAGARAGTALHAIFERVDLAQPVSPAVVEEILAAHGMPASVPEVCAWLDDVLDTPLPADTGAWLSLRTLVPAQLVRELAFTMPVAREHRAQRTARLFEIVRQEFPVDGQLAAVADWHGLLGGFIDLVFEADGRYWLLDWKSNRLGSDDTAYHSGALAAAIAHHGYALQFCLYTLALHRLLALRIPDYDYERHFGGVFYAFVRGMSGKPAAPPGAGVYFARPSHDLVRQLDTQLGGPAESSS